MEKNSYAKQKKKKKKNTSTVTLYCRAVCVARSQVLDPWRQETSSIFIYLFRLEILIVTSEVYVYYQLQCTCHSFGWKGSQGRI